MKSTTLVLVKELSRFDRSIGSISSRLHASRVSRMNWELKTNSRVSSQYRAEGIMSNTSALSSHQERSSSQNQMEHGVSPTKTVSLRLFMAMRRRDQAQQRISYFAMLSLNDTAQRRQNFSNNQDFGIHESLSRKKESMSIRNFTSKHVHFQILSHSSHSRS